MECDDDPTLTDVDLTSLLLRNGEAALAYPAILDFKSDI
jgi:hypothetical protein